MAASPPMLHQTHAPNAPATRSQKRMSWRCVRNPGGIRWNTRASTRTDPAQHAARAAHCRNEAAWKKLTPPGWYTRAGQRGVSTDLWRGRLPRCHPRARKHGAQKAEADIVVMWSGDIDPDKNRPRRQGATRGHSPCAAPKTVISRNSFKCRDRQDLGARRIPREASRGCSAYVGIDSDHGEASCRRR